MKPNNLISYGEVLAVEKSSKRIQETEDYGIA